MNHWQPPAGPPGAATKPAEAFRAEVREAAARWCDDKITGEDFETACGKCKACEARDLMARGDA